MTEAQIDLARRAVAAPGWRWMRGMRIAGTKFASVVAVRDGAPCGAEEGATCDDNAAMWLDGWAPLPDLSDPLTALGLLALVRERWGDPGMYARPRGSKARPDWAVCAGVDGVPVAAGESEVEALVAALEVPDAR